MYELGDIIHHAEGKNAATGISRYSAHVDQKNLLSFVRSMRIPPQEIRLVHGDKDAKLALKTKLEQLYPQIAVTIP